MRGLVWSLWVCLGVCLGIPGAAGAANPELNADAVKHFFDAAFSVQQKEDELAGAVVSVVHRGEVLFKAGYGFAELETRTPADPDASLFRIASITKPFIWTAIMQLVEQGKLGLDDPIDDYLDFEIPATYAEPIRIRHLLTHTPGFEEWGTGSSIRDADDVRDLREYLVERMPARVRAPGLHAAYSNYGTDTAGYIVERISGQTWSDYVDEHILMPLEMFSTNTHVLMDEALKARHAKGYRFEGGQFEATDYDYFGGLPAGHMSTTAADMARFMIAHLNEGALGEARILRGETARQMREPLFAPHPKISPILHGFYRTDRQGLEIFGHGGDVNQFHSNLSLIPALDLGVFISFNSDPGASARSRLVAAFVDHFFAGEYLPVAPDPLEIDLAPYVGEYVSLRRNYSTFEKLSMLVVGVTVSADEQELVLAGGGTDRWIPVEENVFRAKYADRYLVFERDDNGDVSHMVINGALGSLERVDGIDSPQTLQGILAIVFFIALFGAIGYAYRLLRPHLVPLPRTDLVIAWLHCVLVVVLLGYLAYALNSDTREFSYGVPSAAHVSFLLMFANAFLGFAVVGLAARQWMQAKGAVVSRSFYTVVAVGALGNLFIGYYFNILSYVFS